MNITYTLFEEKYLDDISSLQNNWFYEDITFGIISESKEEISGYANEYFYIALDNEKAVGYVTAEVVYGNEYNVFPKGASFLRVNDLYIAKEYRSHGIGEKLLSLTEEKAYSNGVQHIFISSATKDADAVRNFYTRNGYGVWTTMFYKRKDWDVRVFPKGELDGLRFVVIFARYQDKWLYCRAKERNVYETAGGHIEQGETPLEAAKRELYEETGALKFDIEHIFDYSVHNPLGFSNGQVFLAYIEELGVIPNFEMAEVKPFDTYPEKMRFPQILPTLFEKAKEFI